MDSDLLSDIDQLLKEHTPFLVVKVAEGVFGSISFVVTLSVSEGSELVFEISSYEERTQRGPRLHLHTHTTTHSIQLLAPKGDVILPPDNQTQILHQTGEDLQRLVQTIEESAPQAKEHKAKEFESRSRSDISKARDLAERGLLQDSKRLIHLAVEDRLKAMILRNGTSWGHYETPPSPSALGSEMLDCLGLEDANQRWISRSARMTTRAKDHLCQLRDNSPGPDPSPSVPVPVRPSVEASILSLAEEEGQRLVQEMDVVAVFLSGSVARGWGGEESDLDLIAITRSGEEFYTEGREMGLGERQGERQVHVADCFFRMDVADHLVSQGVSSLPAMIQDALPIHDPEDLLNTWRSNLSGKEFWTRRRAITENTHFYLVGQLENTAKEALQAGDLPRAMMAYRHIWDSLCSLALCYNRVLEKGSKLFLRQVFESQLPSWFVKSYKEVWGLRQEDPEQVQELLEKASQSLSKPQPNQHTH